MISISVVIPCYKSEKTIKVVVKEVIEILQSVKEFEIILVDDGSPDHVWEVICSLVKTYPNHVKGICFSKNYGQHSALMAGYRMAQGDIIISMDDDGQADANGIQSLINKINEGYDVVYANYPQTKESILRRSGSWLNSKMSEHLLGKPQHIKETSFNAIRKYVIDDMIRYKNSYPYISGLVFRATNNIGEVRIEHKERVCGTSGYNLKKLISLWMNGFTAFSVQPLRTASFMGIICAFAGFIYGIVIILEKLCNPLIQLGYSSLMAVILFIGGVIMLLLGIIGEYIGRIYISINAAPQYVIRDTAGVDDNKEINVP